MSSTAQFGSDGGGSASAAQIQNRVPATHFRVVQEKPADRS